MVNKIHLIKTVYLYLVVAVSLLFLAIGARTLVLALLKAYLFTEAERREYNWCEAQPPVYGLDAPAIGKIKISSAISEDEKTQIESLLRDYEDWKKNNTPERCYRAERQNNIVDAITMILVSLPIGWIHWKMIQREKDDSGKSETVA